MTNIDDFRTLHEEQKKPNFEALLFRAETLHEDSPADEVQHVLWSAKRLPAIERRRVLDRIKDCTKIPLHKLEEAISEDTGPYEKKPDQRRLALAVLEKNGRENFFATEAHVFRWNGAGAWQALEDRSLKKIIQGALSELGMAVSRGLVDAVTEIFKTEIHIPDHMWQHDADAINFLNGELRYAGGRWALEEHRREHYLATQIPYRFDPEAKAARFSQFLEEVFEGEEDAEAKAKLILEMIGYSLVCHARYEKFILLVGPGANGKSVIMDVVRQIVGPKYAAAVQPSQFGRAFQRAHLHLKLVNLVTEVAEGEVLADADLKAIVSGELTTVEEKNKPPFDMRPYATCWFGTNHMPHTRDFSDALFRRALLVRFNRTFVVGRDADPKLREKLFEEIPGIIQMALQAYAGVIDRGGEFTEPPSCLATKKEWRFEADQAAQFIIERCDKDTDACIHSGELYQAYKVWAHEEGIRSRLSHKSFSSRLQRLGFKLKPGTNGKRMVHGLRLRKLDEEGFFG